MLRKPKLVWRLYLSFLLIIIPSLLAVAWYTARSMKRVYLEETAASLGTQARLAEVMVAEKMAGDQSGAIDALCKSIGSKVSTRITVILPSGLVIGDSEEDPDRMDNHTDRPEIREALEGKEDMSSRYSTTLAKEMMYVAIPLKIDGSIIGVVRTATPVASISQTIRGIYFQIALAGLVVALLAVIISFLAARRFDRPLQEIKEGALRFAGGDLHHRLLPGGSDEINTVADALNTMASQLNERIQTITRQRNELETVLGSMVEGVLAVDHEERIIRFNRAAGNLFRVDPAAVQGKSIQEAIRNPDLHRFVSDTLSRRETTEGEIVVANGGEHILRAHGTLFFDPAGSRSGALVVLSDVTHLKKLEQVRRDFVANVSHELKTPITTVKGFVETLRDGALKTPEDANKFLEIISRNADRLNAILEDLLSLSRIEQDEERAQLSLQPGKIREVLEAARMACEKKSSEKNVSIEIICDPDVQANINPDLLEQAVVNLIDNAVKYSDPGSRVEVEGLRADGEALIRVRDSGCGIPEEHIPRLFERFYRVDKARSRQLGGTGLGLAIVKHIVLAHGGQVMVESIPEKGSTFTIHLPAG